MIHSNKRKGKAHIIISTGEEKVLDATGAADADVTVAVRPEGFVLEDGGTLTLSLSRVEVMGRDVSIVSTHAASQNDTVRSIIGAENIPAITGTSVRFSLKPNKVFVFDRTTGERIMLSLR